MHHIDVGCATPIAYESWISHLSAIPAATKLDIKKYVIDAIVDQAMVDADTKS